MLTTTEEDRQGNSLLLLCDPDVYELHPDFNKSKEQKTTHMNNTKTKRELLLTLLIECLPHHYSTD